jgi:hypothetical protein
VCSAQCAVRRRPSANEYMHTVLSETVFSELSGFENGSSFGWTFRFDTCHTAFCLRVSIFALWTDCGVFLFVNELWRGTAAIKGVITLLRRSFPQIRFLRTYVYVHTYTYIHMYITHVVCMYITTYVRNLFISKEKTRTKHVRAPRILACRMLHHASQRPVCCGLLHRSAQNDTQMLST